MGLNLIQSSPTVHSLPTQLPLILMPGIYIVPIPITVAVHVVDHSPNLHCNYIRQNVLFWTDVEARVIARSNLDGSNATLLVDSDLSYPGNLVQKVHCQHV